jgi:hypothetical protein
VKVKLDSGHLLLAAVAVIGVYVLLHHKSSTTKTKRKA